MGRRRERGLGHTDLITTELIRAIGEVCVNRAVVIGELIQQIGSARKVLSHLGFVVDFILSSLIQLTLQFENDFTLVIAARSQCRIPADQAADRASDDKGNNEVNE